MPSVRRFSASGSPPWRASVRLARTFSRAFARGTRATLPRPSSRRRQQVEGLWQVLGRNPGFSTERLIQGNTGAVSGMAPIRSGGYKVFRWTAARGAGRLARGSYAFIRVFPGSNTGAAATVTGYALSMYSTCSLVPGTACSVGR